MEDIASNSNLESHFVDSNAKVGFTVLSSKNHLFILLGSLIQKKVVNNLQF